MNKFSTISFINSADDDLALAFWVLFYLVVSREILILISYKSSEVRSMEKLHLFT